MPARTSLSPRWSWILPVAVAAVLAGAGSALAAGPVFRFAPCAPDVFAPEVTVECGSVTVPENRARPFGRRITVAAAILRAPASRPKSDPIVFLDGGPSFGAVNQFAVDFYFGGAPYAEDRDVILVDTRGTGFSQPRLGCPEFDAAFVSQWYSKPFVESSRAADYEAAAAACRDRLAGTGVDLSAYDSAESAADLDDLRRALGYKRWNLIAWSADGVLGLTYMRLYPGAIRSAIIDSGQSPQMLGPLDYARGNTEVLERVFAGCAANAACNATYPNIRGVFYDLVHHLQRHPAIIPIPGYAPAPITLRVDGAWFYTDALYELFPGNRFEGESIHWLLSEIWRSAHGELDSVMRERVGPGPNDSINDSFFAEGKTMSYLCRDVIGFVTQRDLEQAARDVPELAPDILAPGYAAPFGPSGCRVWDVGVADPAQHQPVTSAIPTLVLAGEFDSGGGVPAYITRQIPLTLANSFYYEFPAGAHGQLADYNTASPCARAIAAQFLAAPARRPDSRCVAALAPFDFTPPPDASPTRSLAPAARAPARSAPGGRRGLGRTPRAAG